jgi:hypothetical protein
MLEIVRNGTQVEQSAVFEDLAAVVEDKLKTGHCRVAGNGAKADQKGIDPLTALQAGAQGGRSCV